ncbi:MAG TPA: HAMP domain-containing sensor histidine kinase [Candidatus Sulfotelmatobacter sp.]|nr:HAMP domain-containing sensor histidine kinase [Candidatus Sulfotelmatobacter sp.]
MTPFRRYRWFFAAAGFTLAFAVVSFTAHKSYVLAAFGDLAGLFVMLIAAAVALVNSRNRPPSERSFWALMTLGFLLWVTNQTAWSYWDLWRRQAVPDPFFFDIILFFHTVPLIAAVAWRPDLLRKEGKLYRSLVNFLMLSAWWIFLYAFIVFPTQYIVPDVRLYNIYYDRLFGLENLILLAALGFAVLTSVGGWRRFYLHLLGAGLVYGINSQLLDRAAADQTYYSGCPYDIGLIGTVSWIAAAFLSARQWELKPSEFPLNLRWKRLLPQMAMLTMLSLPVLGWWTVEYDPSPAPSRAFRITAVLAAMLLLGTFLFLRQYFQDQELVSLLKKSRDAYESQKQLQGQLVQREKLASLGNLVSGAAHDINQPLSAVMTCSEQLWAKERLTDQQNALVRKIVNQARRTSDLVANLLSFAQQTPGEKVLVDLPILLTRATQMLEARRSSGKIEIRSTIDPDFPQVWVNANRMFQAFVEILENAMDALDESGGGIIEITASRHGSDIQLQFSDNGPGLRDPQRVFDPFYTTKPIGRGTGLGLSAVYGVVQDHAGQITCQNKPEGGALFTILIPVTRHPAAQVASAT